ncbi:MAG: helix-turn-helix domain-containing protein [Bdellovibrionales bacterium]
MEILKQNNGNQRKTASELGIPKSTLHDRIKKYQIEVKDFKYIQF